MLEELVVENLGVIEHAELSLDEGSTALTGETGAGKTLVVAALSLLTGGRADKTMVRSGVSEARIEGRFTVDSGHPAADFLAAHGLIGDVPRDPSVELVLSRTITSTEGKGRARINGRLVPAGILAGAGRALVEIASQHEHQQLGRASVQRNLLDAFAGTERLAAEASEAARATARLRRQLDDLESSEKQRARDLDVLRFEIEEIEAVHLEEGESDSLTEQARRLEHAEALAAGVNRAIDALSGERGAVAAIHGARSELVHLGDKDTALATLATRLEDARYEIEDIVDALKRGSVEPDPRRLEEIRDRLGLLARLKRKYGSDEAEMLEYLDQARRRADELTGADEERERYRGELQHQAATAAALAAELSKKRHAASPRLKAAVEEALSELALDQARFEIKLENRSLYDGGVDTVEFLVAANPGEIPRPLAKVASGGELSRIGLALHLVTATQGAPTMVFDEADAGIGGQAARAVGRALAELSRAAAAQVLVVTHLPQVAAFADHHFVVTKGVMGTEQRRRGVVTKVEGDERVAELSRMLAGLPDSRRAKEHARELLDLAAGTVRT